MFCVYCSLILIYNKNCSENVEFIYTIVPQMYTIWGRINMQINTLPAGGAVVAGELEVSPEKLQHDHRM